MQTFGRSDSLSSLEYVELEAHHVEDVVELVLEKYLTAEQAKEFGSQLRADAEDKVDTLGDGVALLHEQVSTPDLELQILVRLSKPLPLQDGAGVSTRYVWVLLSDKSTHCHLDSAVEFARLMSHQAFRQDVADCHTAEEIATAYYDHLDSEVQFRGEVPEELRATGRLFGGVIQDIRRRFPHYRSDFADGLNTKSLGATLFLYFACLAPAIAFGGLLSVLTKGTIGAIEMIVSTAVAGIIYALFSAQPLTILGSTGPVIIFMGLLYPLCERMGTPYLPTLAWVGLWTTVMLLVLAATDACSWIRYFTRFTDETFAALISIIFIVEALKDIVHVFTDNKVSHATALLSLLLAVGTFTVATNLSRFRRSPYLRRWVREFLADFGPAIAIVAMTAVAFALQEVELQTLAVPDSFSTTSGRPWLVNPLDAPMWVWGAAAVPALLVSILLYLDQNITVRLVNNPDYDLSKGAGYHLDLVVVALLVAVCSLFGLPWMVAATVRSLNHVRSLATVETDRQGVERVVSVSENRITGLSVHVLIALSLLVLPWLKIVPMSVLFGLFLFMGVASMAGNQMFERLRLWFMDPERYPTNYYLRAVPTKVVHHYTSVQVACLAVLWVVKASVLGILFPLFIGLLAPVRMKLGRFFSAEHLALLDAEEMPEEEEDRVAGP